MSADYYLTGNSELILRMQFKTGSSGGARRMAQGRRRRREVRPLVLVEDCMTTVGGGQRWEIIRALGESPLSVSAISQKLFLRPNVVSRELACLEEHGLVTCKREARVHTYRLTESVTLLRQGGMIQIVISSGQGHWILVHVDAEDSDIRLPPPRQFVG